MKKGNGKGDYQITLESINILKIFHRLTVHPYPYELLWYLTSIQRNRLRSLLNEFVRKKMVIPHKYKTIDKFPEETKLIEIKPHLIYYILDLDNEDSLRYLRDLELDEIVKDCFRINFIYPFLRKMKTKKMNSKKRMFNSELYEKNYL